MEERKDRRLLKIVALLLLLGLAMAWGMVVGGGLVYAWTRAGNLAGREAASRTIVLDERLGQWRQELGQGAAVVAVVPGGPAAEAGLRTGDRIVAVDGISLGAGQQLSQLIARYEPGERVVLRIAGSSNAASEVRVRLGEHPDVEGRAYLGVQVSTAGDMGSPNIRILPAIPGELGLDLPFGRSGCDCDCEEAGGGSPFD